MAKKNKEEVVEQDNNVQISIEQICAAILSTVGAVTVNLDDLLKDYSSKSIAVNQDEETKSLTFSLADTPAQPEIVQEAEAE